MKIVVTGSTGRISRQLTVMLVKAGHLVTVISTNPEKRNEIESLGAMAAIGSIDDLTFLKNTFVGHDAVYTMIPPFKFLEDPTIDARAEAKRLARNYAEAIQDAGIKKVVHLSSIGAHLERGNGLLAFHFYAEQVLNQLPKDVNITFMRPVGFYYNLYDFLDIMRGDGFLKGFVGVIMTLRFYGFIGLIRGKKGLIISNYGAIDKIPWVSPTDIAAAIAEEFSISTSIRKVRYVASEELTCNEVATILGNAIGKPYLKWGTISDKQMLDGLKQYKVPQRLANDIMEMNSSMHTGVLFQDYYKNRPAPGKVKLKDFAKEFAIRYHQK